METSLRIFIAEDESIILTSFKMLVVQMGHQVVGTALDGEAAEQGILETKPDLVLVDINMPKKSGLQVMKAVNEQGFIPCIVITGHFSEQLSDEAAESGAFGYLIKPVDGKQLRATIQVVEARCEEFAELRSQTETLKQALEDRKTIEKAKGILMDRFSLREMDAMRALQKQSKDKNRKLVLVAQDVIRAESLLG